MNLSDVQILIGALVLSNLGAIGSVAYFLGSKIWWAARLDLRVEKLERDMNAAHTAIRKQQKQILINTNKE